MPELADIWAEALPKVLSAVTGRGVWTALNAARPVTIEDGVLVLGMPSGETELAGHLRLPQTHRLLEVNVSTAAGQQYRVRVIDGTTLEDWEVVKRRDAERRRMQDAEMAKMRAELTARTSWDSVYEQLSRRWAAVPNKSLPQNRARFFEEGSELIAEARKAIDNFDELQERNFARCLERLSQYTEIPSTLVGVAVLKKAGEL